jgi:hypothetical protein
MVKVPRAAGDREKVLLRLDGEQRETLLVGWPAQPAGGRIAPNADAVGRLNENVALVADARDDLAEDLDVAGRLPVRAAGVDVHDGRTGPIAAVGVLGDLGRRHRHLGAVAGHLRTTVDCDEYDKLLLAHAHLFLPAKAGPGACTARGPATR